MKKSLPVTLDDLQATARDDFAGVCMYRKLTIIHQQKTNSFDYYHNNHPCNEAFVISTLKAMK